MNILVNSPKGAYQEIIIEAGKTERRYSKDIWNYRLGLALMAQGRNEDAEFHFRRSVQIDPDYVKALEKP
jgi:hypothetical protein